MVLVGNLYGEGSLKTSFTKGNFSYIHRQNYRITRDSNEVKISAFLLL